MLNGIAFHIASSDLKFQIYKSGVSEIAFVVANSGKIEMNEMGGACGA